jgi:hypothetical protein
MKASENRDIRSPRNIREALLCDDSDDEVHAQHDGDDDGDFTMEDMEHLQDMGVDGVLTGSFDEGRDASRVRRTRDGSIMKGSEAAEAYEQDTVRDARRAGEESLKIQRENREAGRIFQDGGKSSKPRKASKNKSQKSKPSAGKYRPSRTRVASADEGNPFDSIWGVPDSNDAFVD